MRSHHSSANIVSSHIFVKNHPTDMRNHSPTDRVSLHSTSNELTLWRLNNWQKVLLTRLNFFQQKVVTSPPPHPPKKSPKIMNEQKVIKFCMLILKSIGHCFGFLVAMTVSRADNYGCFWQTSSCPCKTCIQKRHAWKKRKNNTKTETEISQTVIRLQHVFF